jgi:polyisoprenoid-binding protein YceI
MTWNIDPSHTLVNFSVRHMMISLVHGTFDGVSGTVNFYPDKPAQTTVDFQIAADSLTTSDPRDGAFLILSKYIPHSRSGCIIPYI